MAFSAGDKITTSDIITYAYNYIIEGITDGAITSTTVPTSPLGQPVVPVKYLDASLDLPEPVIGASGSRIDGKDNGTSFTKTVTSLAIYNALVYLTKRLLAVGTYCYGEHTVYTNANDTTYYYTNKYTKTGKCIFNTDTMYEYFGISAIVDAPLVSNVSTNAAVVDGSVVTPNKITISTITALCANCITAYNVSKKIHIDTYYSKCHTNCHTSCHTSCNCNCHTFENCNYNNHAAQEADPDNYVCEICQCYDNSPWYYGDICEYADENRSGGDTCNCDGTYTCHNNTTSTVNIYTYIGSSCHTNSTYSG